jgi:hypothetical protein
MGVRRYFPGESKIFQEEAKHILSDSKNYKKRKKFLKHTIFAMEGGGERAPLSPSEPMKKPVDSELHSQDPGSAFNLS